MKFLTRRTTEYFDIKPCEEAIEGTYTHVDIRMVDDPAKIPAEKGTDWWYKDKDFTNHRVENGQIKRDRILKGWFVEINTLEELVEFTKKYDGDVIISTNNENNPEFYELEIYDNYRE